MGIILRFKKVCTILIIFCLNIVQLQAEDLSFNEYQDEKYETISHLLLSHSQLFDPNIVQNFGRLPNVGCINQNTHESNLLTFNFDTHNLINARSKEKVQKYANLVELVIDLRTNNTQPYGVTKMNCNSLVSPEAQQVTSDLLNELADGTIPDLSTYIKELELRTQDFTSIEKLCLVSENADEYQNYYTDNLAQDGIGNEIGSEEVILNYAKGESGDPTASTGVCIQIHKASAEEGNAIGLQCGTIANQWDEENGGRFMHAVNLCKDPSSGKYYMINYGKVFELDTDTFQSSIDAANMSLANANMAGNVMSCIDDQYRSIYNCNHAYLPRDSRWVLSSITDQLNYMEDGSPLYLEIGKQEIEGRLSILNNKNILKIKRDGTTRYIDRTTGLLLGANNYNFGQAQVISGGFGLNQTSETNNSTSSSSFYAGLFHASAKNIHTAYFSTEEKMGFLGILVYFNKEKNRDLTDSLILRTRSEIVGSVGVDTLISNGESADPGLTNEFTIGLEQQIGDSGSISIDQTSSVMTGNQNNLPTFYFGKTSLGYTHDFFEGNYRVELNNETQFHLLYGAPTFAIQNTTNFSMNITDRLNSSISSDIGYTFESDDPFYNEGLWYEIESDLEFKVFENKNIFLSGYYQNTSAQTPQQFGEGLTIEDNPIPESTLQGHAGGLTITFRPRNR